MLVLSHVMTEESDWMHTQMVECGKSMDEAARKQKTEQVWRLSCGQ